MKLYYIETTVNHNGDQIVHLSECDEVPNFLSRKLIGRFNTCEAALQKVKKTYPRANGCPACLSACHTPTEEINE